MKPGVLYLSYDGMLEPLGQSQVLAYLAQLAPDFRIHLVSFEKPEDWADRPRRDALRKQIARAGIQWTPLTYHRRPTAPATAFDVATGIAVGTALVFRHRLAIIHARSYVAGTMALAIKRLTGVKLLFDMRGFWADERVDGGLWARSGRLYRGAKAMERRLLRAADHVVTLTEAHAAELRRFPYLAGRMPPLSVIPTCADLTRFRRDESGTPQAGFVLGYTGAVGTWHRFDDVLRCFSIVQSRRPDARLLVVNRGEHQLIREATFRLGIAPEQVEIVAADFADMPRQVARMDAGVAIRMATYSQLGCAPTKLAEYLGCGVPCLGNRGVGDVEPILVNNRVGAVLEDFSEAAMTQAVDRLLALTDDPAIASRCVETARRVFSLEQGVAAYAAAYRTMLG